MKSIKTTKNLLLLCFFHVSFLCFSQDLFPFVEYFTKDKYKGDNQVWSITQGKDKTMYMANNRNLLRFDDSRWEKYSLPNRAIIRAVYAKGDTIYSGSFKEFGYWLRKDGKMIYYSISQRKFKFSSKSTDEIWKIFEFNHKIYFQSFSSLYEYDGRTVKKWNLPWLISYAFVIDGKLYLCSVNQGVFIFDGKNILAIKQWDSLKNTVIHSIRKIKGDFWFFTREKGVYIYHNNKIERWNDPLNAKLIKEGINTASISKNILTVGTASHGIYLYNFSNDTYQNIEKINSKINNTALNDFIDAENSLWLGLDNGIVRIEINSPLKIFNDYTGSLGSVYSVIPYSSGYLLASNHGLFNFSNQKLSIFPETLGQTWSINPFFDSYLIGHNNGTFEWKNGNLSLLNNINGGWMLTPSLIPGYYLQSTYSGIYVYDKNKRVKKIEGVSVPIRYIQQSNPHEIWGADMYKGLYRIKIDADFKVKSIENITLKNKIDNDYFIKILKFNDVLLFLINGVWYHYEATKDELVLDEVFNKNFKNIKEISQVNNNSFVLYKDGLLYYINYKNNVFEWLLIPEKYYKGNLASDDYIYTYLYDNKLIVNLDEGFLLLNLNKINPNSNFKLNLEAYQGEKFLEKQPTINYNSEAIDIYAVSNIYGFNKPNLFYKLRETDKDYISVYEGKVSLSNLPSDNYKLTFYTQKNGKYIQVGNYKFSVAAPWFISKWMIGLYLLLICGILFVYIKWTQLKYQQKINLREEELKHQQSIREIELKAENEKQLSELKNEKLHEEVDQKTSEIAGKAMAIAKQNEIFDTIKEIIDNNSEINSIKSKIIKLIQTNKNNTKDWEVFENNLNQIHKDFILKLSEKHPLLTPKDIRLCIYLRMNLSSKEIAPLLGISYRSVELHRYRLRKKINLANDVILSNYMLNI